jgi:hypothetical protein
MDGMTLGDGGPGFECESRALLAAGEGRCGRTFFRRASHQKVVNHGKSIQRVQLPLRGCTRWYARR